MTDYLPATVTGASEPALHSYVQLVTEIINGSVRRHTFSALEMELLFDLRTGRLRRNSRGETLRRYIRAVQHQIGQTGEVLRLRDFLQREAAPRLQSLPKAG